METMAQNETIQEMLRLFEQNGHKEQSAELSTLLWYADGLARQYEAVLQQLADVQGQLAKMTERKSPSQEALDKSMTALRVRLDAVRQKFADIRNHVTAWAKDTVENFQIAGVTALDRAVSAIHLKGALETAQKGLQDAVADVNTAIDRAEVVNFELHTAKRHIRNALYAAIGKAPPSRLRDGELFGKAVLSPLRGIKKALNGMNNNMLGAIGMAEHLEERAAQARDRRAEKKASIRQELKEMKELSASRTAPEQQHERKPQEAAI